VIYSVERLPVDRAAIYCSEPMTDPSETIDEDLAEIVDAVGRQDRDGAIGLAMAAFERGLDHPLILLLTAEGLDAGGRGPEALEILRRVTTEEPGEAEGWRRLGATLAGQGKLDEARRAFETALGIDPGVYWTLLAVGSVSFKLGDLGAAEGYYRRAADVAPDQAEPRAALATIAARRNEPRSPQGRTWGLSFKLTQTGRPS
jgi:tetratricopeptide (TPR) repeat protein